MPINIVYIVYIKVYHYLQTICSDFARVCSAQIINAIRVVQFTDSKMRSINCNKVDICFKVFFILIRISCF